MQVSLLISFPPELLESDKRTYGCPDCADQEGFYIELNDNGQRNKWRLDTNDDGQSEAIILYKKMIDAVMEDLR